MKRFAFALIAGLSLSAVSMTGCGGGGESKVIEAPPAESTDGAMEGMSEEEYNAAMEKSMSEQGN